jgi:surfeit locus 1 family protein
MRRERSAGMTERAGILVPSLFALMVLATFVALGTWQLQRKAWKEQLIDMLARRLSMLPADLPGSDNWPALVPGEHEFQRVKFAATFVPGEEALVYAGASALRPDITGPGYWVLAPARLASGAVIVVNRGFVPEGRQDPGSRPRTDSPDALSLVGAMRWPEDRGYFVPNDDPGRNLWFVRDPVAIAEVKGWGRIAPFYIDLEEPQPPEGLPRPGRLRVGLRNEHLQYALTWYALALVVVVMFALWVSRRGGRGRVRRGADQDPSLPR